MKDKRSILKASGVAGLFAKMESLPMVTPMASSLLR